MYTVKYIVFMKGLFVRNVYVSKAPQTSLNLLYQCSRILFQREIVLVLFALNLTVVELYVVDESENKFKVDRKR